MSASSLRGAPWALALALVFACGQAKQHEAAASAHAHQPAQDAQAHVAEADAATLSAGDAAPRRCDPAAGPAPLEAAAFAGDAEKARMLIVTAEQDAAARSVCGPSALSLALTPFPEEPGATAEDRRVRHHGKLDAAGLFLTRCFEVLRPDEQGVTALHVVVTSPHPDRVAARLVRRMLECAPRPDPVTSEGVTPLMLAIREKRRAIVKLLLEAGADVNARSAAGDTPLELAEKSRDREILALMRKAIPYDAGARASGAGVPEVVDLANP